MIVFDISEYFNRQSPCGEITENREMLPNHVRPPFEFVREIEDFKAASFKESKSDRKLYTKNAKQIRIQTIVIT